MSVLILDMALPRSCFECCFYDTDFRWCRLTNGKHPDPENKDGICPLIEIQEGKLFGIHNGILYEANVKIPDNWGKTIKIPPIRPESEGE